MTSDGNAGKKMKGCGGAPTRGSGTDYGDYERPCGGGDSYGSPDGWRYPNPPLAGAFVPSCEFPLEKQIRSNKGFQATAHNLSLCKRFPSLQSYILMPVGRRLNPDVGPS